MNKMRIGSGVAVILLASPCAFAQFNNPAKMARNWTNLQRVVARTTQIQPVTTVISWVPSRFVKGGKIGLSPLPLPQQLTPVTRSILTKVKGPVEVKHMHRLANQFVLWAYGEHGYGKAFYDDQTQLARDLHNFYDAQPDTFIGPDGHEVKLYALPVDGILYKPLGYKTPVVLNPDEYFVIYDTQTDTGKIAQNKPEVYNLFKPRVEDEIWQAMGNGKVFDDLSNLCSSILMAHLHKARIDQLHADKVPQDIQDLMIQGQMPYADFVKMKTADTKTVVKESKSLIYKQLNTQEKLLDYLHSLPQLTETSHGFKAYVVELPVEGLTWVEADGTAHVYNPQDYVMLFFEVGSAGVFPRGDVANPERFIPVKK